MVWGSVKSDPRRPTYKATAERSAQLGRSRYRNQNGGRACALRHLYNSCSYTRSTGDTCTTPAATPGPQETPVQQLQLHQVHRRHLYNSCSYTRSTGNTCTTAAATPGPQVTPVQHLQLHQVHRRHLYNSCSYTRSTGDTCTTPAATPGPQVTPGRCFPWETPVGEQKQGLVVIC
ncbi:hypothetical protein Bbelb_068000 [Branchiostoma belcheri]|nr:hypothetical protein Bbelb_068000 [Branchiostoma belcheri]